MPSFLLTLTVLSYTFPPFEKDTMKTMMRPSNLLSVTKVELKIERHQSETLIHHLSYIHSQFPQRVKRHQYTFQELR